MKDISKNFLDVLGQDQILETMPSGLFLVDNDRNIVYWNREAERITGYTAAEVVGQRCSFLQGIECGNVCGLFDAETPEKPILGAECRIRTNSGEVVTISKNVDFLRKNGKIIGGVESFVDISAHKRYEAHLQQQGDLLEATVNKRTAALREERTRLHSVIYEMPDPAYIVQDDYRLSFLNKAMERIIGPSAGRTCFEALQHRHEPCSDCTWNKVKKGQVVHEERQLGSNKRFYEIIHSPLNAPDGKTDKLGVCRDITERKESADKLMELNKQLDSFAHTVSHDLRSPLTGVICYTELIKDKFGEQLKGEGLELLSEVERQGQRMLNIIEDLLLYSTAEHIKPVDTPVKVNEVIKQVLLDNKFEIEEKGAEITVGELPELLVPNALLYELTSNLILNALRYGCEQGGKIDISGETGNEYYSILVSDHGPGIPESERESVFEVFVRGSTSVDILGTGIGLATVDKIMQRFKGGVQLEETAGGGCTFILFFPVVG